MYYEPMSNNVAQRATVYNCCPGWARISKNSPGCNKRKQIQVQRIHIYHSEAAPSQHIGLTTQNTLASFNGIQHEHESTKILCSFDFSNAGKPICSLREAIYIL